MQPSGGVYKCRLPGPSTPVQWLIRISIKAAAGVGGAHTPSARQGAKAFLCVFSLNSGGSDAGTIPIVQRRKLRLGGVTGLTQHPTQEVLQIPFVVQQGMCPPVLLMTPGLCAGPECLPVFLCLCLPRMLWAELSCIPGGRPAKGCVWRPWGGEEGGRAGSRRSCDLISRHLGP